MSARQTSFVVWYPTYWKPSGIRLCSPSPLSYGSTAGVPLGFAEIDPRKLARRRCGSLLPGASGGRRLNGQFILTSCSSPAEGCRRRSWPFGRPLPHRSGEGWNPVPLHPPSQKRPLSVACRIHVRNRGHLLRSGRICNGMLGRSAPKSGQLNIEIGRPCFCSPRWLSHINAALGSIGRKFRMGLQECLP